ncbi:unnamed protein product, partial [Ranitomeya imitator]
RTLVSEAYFTLVDEYCHQPRLLLLLLAAVVQSVNASDRRCRTQNSNTDFLVKSVYGVRARTKCFARRTFVTSRPRDCDVISGDLRNASLGMEAAACTTERREDSGGHQKLPVVSAAQQRMADHVTTDLQLGSVPGLGPQQWPQETSFFSSRRRLLYAALLTYSYPAFPPAASRSVDAIVEGQHCSLCGPRLLRSTNILCYSPQRSVEDFTAFGGVYGNKQDSAFPETWRTLWSPRHPLWFCPLWTGTLPTSLPTYLKEKLGVSPLHVDQTTLLELRLKRDYPIPAHSKDVLRANDEVIGQVLSTLKSEGVPYTALLTALRPSRVNREIDFSVGSFGRQLLAAATPTYPPLSYNGTQNQPCILFWASNITVAMDRELDLTFATFQGTEPITEGSFCNNTDARSVMPKSRKNKEEVDQALGHIHTFVFLAAQYKTGATDPFEGVRSPQTNNGRARGVSPPRILSRDVGFFLPD